MSIVACAPGETIRENMNTMGLTIEEFAYELRISPHHLRKVLIAKAPIDEVLAIELERVVGPSKQFWLNLEKNYRDRVK